MSEHHRGLDQGPGTEEDTRETWGKLDEAGP